MRFVGLRLHVAELAAHGARDRIAHDAVTILLAPVGMVDKIEKAVRSVLAAGYRTADIHQPGTKKVGTAEMGEAVVAALELD